MSIDLSSLPNLEWYTQLCRDADVNYDIGHFMLNGELWAKQPQEWEAALQEYRQQLGGTFIKGRVSSGSTGIYALSECRLLLSVVRDLRERKVEGVDRSLRKCTENPLEFFDHLFVLRTAAAYTCCSNVQIEIELESKQAGGHWNPDVEVCWKGRKLQVECRNNVISGYIRNRQSELAAEIYRYTQTDIDYTDATDREFLCRLNQSTDAWLAEIQKQKAHRQKRLEGTLNAKFEQTRKTVPHVDDIRIVAVNLTQNPVWPVPDTPWLEAREVALRVFDHWWSCSGEAPAAAIDFCHYLTDGAGNRALWLWHRVTNPAADVLSDCPTPYPNVSLAVLEAARG